MSSFISPWLSSCDCGFYCYCGSNVAFDTVVFWSSCHAAFCPNLVVCLLTQGSVTFGLVRLRCLLNMWLLPRALLSPPANNSSPRTDTGWPFKYLPGEECVEEGHWGFHSYLRIRVKIKTNMLDQHQKWMSCPPVQCLVAFLFCLGWFKLTRPFSLSLSSTSALVWSRSSAVLLQLFQQL